MEITFKDQVEVVPDKILSAQSKKDMSISRSIQHAVVVEHNVKSLLKAQQARVKRAWKASHAVEAPSA